MAGYSWADVGKRLPFDQFVQFVHYSPPGTALYHAVHKGWTVTDYLITDALELLDWLAWTKTKSAQNNKNRPKRRLRPETDEQEKQKKKTAPQPLTVAEYVRRTGMKIELE